MLLLLGNPTEATTNEMIAVQLNSHHIHLNNIQNDQNCKMPELGGLTHHLSK